MDDNVPIDKKTKFNAGIAKLERISEIRKGLADAKISTNWYKWYYCLISWRSELNAKMDPGSRNSAKDHEQRIRVCLANYYTRKKQGKRPDYYPPDFLYDYELFLGDCEDKIGMGMPDSEDALDAANKI